MYLNTLELSNFKQFENIKFELAPSFGTNLIIGSNMSGKTNLLLGIIRSLGFIMEKITVFNQAERRTNTVLIQKDIRETIDGQVNSEVFIKATFVNSDEKWDVVRSRNQRNKNIIETPGINYVKSILNSFQAKGDFVDAPFIYYGSTGRLFTEANDRKYNAKLGRFNGYFRVLSDTSIPSYVDKWIQDVAASDIELERRRGERNIGYQVLQGAMAKVVRLFFDLDVEPDFYYSTIFKEIAMLIPDRPTLPLSAYSDGARNLIRMITEMIWRAIVLNPHLGAHVLEQTKGIALIDEIDLHLHPKWQSKVISILENLFPCVQFIITTHSPTVINSLSKGKLYIIDNLKMHQYDGRFYGKEISDVIENILGAETRPSKVAELLHSLVRIAGSNDSANYQQLYDEAIEILGRDDRELVYAESLKMLNGK